MSKVIVYVLDKFVWMLIVTVFTTQALQIAGLIDAPKGLGEIGYDQDREYEYGLSVGDGDVREKRQTQERSQVIDNIFNIPIATLNAVNNLVQSTRPAFQRIREVAQRRLDAANEAAAASQVSHVRRARRPLTIYRSSHRLNPEAQPNESRRKVALDI